MLKKCVLFVGVAFLIALVAGVITTWPLPRYAGQGISALHRAEHGSLRVSMPGDHLQLMYFFQLMRDFVAGDTPWFHNLYEFNTGNDAEHYALDFYYVPFSLVFTFVDLVTGNPALAWNLTGFCSLWLGVLGLLLLVRRFSKDGWVILAAVLAGTVLPYRLITFLHGSPTGFGIAYVPFMLLGLDYAIRNKKTWGGVLAGAFFFFSEWVDLHVYFFLALVTPFWCVFVYLYENVSFDWKRIRKTAIALIPFVLFVCAAALRVWLIHRGLKDSVMAQGRTVTEVAQFAPAPNSYWSLNPDHPSSYVYMTFMIPVMVLLGMVHAFWSLRREGASSCKRMQFLLYLGLLVGIGGILLLGLGPRIPLPRADRLWELFVRVVRPYRMIRQPAKVLILLPSLLAVLVALPFAGDARIGPILRRRWIFGILGALLLGEVAWRIDPAISLLDKEQRAYAAIVERAAERGEVPRAISVVLWPGDTHWASLYQYYGMKYRIRMINGYSPSVSASYFDDVFLRFVSLNRGYASDEQLDDLLKRGIRYIVIHEDAFPEKVSPFGVAQTIKGFLENPRIRLLAQDRAVWSFEIMEFAATDNLVAVPWQTASVTYAWDAEWLGDDAVPVMAGPSVHGGRYVKLAREEDIIHIPDWGIHYVDRLRLSARVRGHGTLQARMVLESNDVHEASFGIASDDWIWQDIPYPVFDGLRTNLQFSLTGAAGAVDVDYVYVAQGEVPDNLAIGEVFRMPAPTLFRAGYTDLDQDSVVFRPELVPAAHVLYGPRLPLPIGRYMVRLLYWADVDAEIGRLGFRYLGNGDNPDEVSVIGAAGVAEIEYRQTANLPITIELFYNRAGEMRIQALEIERVE